MRVSAGGWSGFGRALGLTALLSAFADPAVTSDGEYDAILATLAQTGPESAVTQLIDGLPDLEEGSVGRNWQQRRRAQLRVARTLADGRQPEVLLPIIDLHDRTQRELRHRGNVLAADQERITAFLMTDILAQQVSSEEMRQTAGDLFAVQAGYFHQASPGPTAADLYGRALTFDWANEAALSGLAHIFESKGQHRKALLYLEILFVIAPGREETRLRRAINLERVGRQREATYGLDGLLRDESPNWVVDIAIQELARVALDRGDFREAKRIVQLGLTRLDEEATLMVVAAYVDDRLGVGSADGSVGVSPGDAAVPRPVASRYRYSQWSSDLVLEALDRIRRAADDCRPILEEALREKTRSDAAR